jgi:hypothetical protein
MNQLIEKKINHFFIQSIAKNIMSFLYESDIKEVRFATFLHLFQCLTSKRKNNKSSWEHPLFLFGNRFPLLDNRKNPYSVLKKWFKLFDLYLMKMSLEELERIKGEPISKSALYAFHYFSWKRTGFSMNDDSWESLKVAEYALDVKYIEELWDTTEISFQIPLQELYEFKGTRKQVFILLEKEEKQHLLQGYICFANDFIPIEEKRNIIIVERGNNFCSFTKENIKIYVKEEKKIEKFCITENDCVFHYVLGEGNGFSKRICPFDEYKINIQTIFLLSYVELEKRKIKIFRLLKKIKKNNWLIRNPNHKEEIIDLYDFEKAIIYQIENKLVKTSEWLHLTCLAVPYIHESINNIQTFHIETEEEGIIQLLSPKLIECCELGWLGRELFVSNDSIWFCSFTIPENGKKAFIRSICKKISSLLPKGYLVASEETNECSITIFIEHIKEKNDSNFGKYV